MNTSTRSLSYRTVATVCAVLLLAAACGSDDATGTTTSATTDETAAGQTTVDTSSGSTDGEVAAHVDVDLFFDGALADDPTLVGCSLSDGTETDCYQITIAGYPADTEIGPFCPTTTSDTADEVGIWLDGEELYDIDGQFILDLPEIYEDDNWHLHDDEGNVNVTDTQEAFEGAARPDVDPEYQNHCVEGQLAWLDGGEPITSTVEIPSVPVAGSSATQISGSVGVTLNGVIIDGQAPIQAILGAYTIAAFDDCGGHLNPFDGYHLHGATGCSEIADPGDGDTPAFAYAMDGYAIHSPLDEELAASAELDECNGHVTEASGYHYHANQPQLNAVLSCFTGTAITAGR